MDCSRCRHGAWDSGSEPGRSSCRKAAGDPGIVFSYEMKGFVDMQHPLYVLDTCYSGGGPTRARRSFLCLDLDAESQNLTY
jgi:hypothetical protein